MDTQKKTHIIVISTKNNPQLCAVVAANLGTELAENELKTTVVMPEDEKSPLCDFFRERNKLPPQDLSNLPILSYKKISEKELSSQDNQDVIIIPSCGDKDDFKSAFFFADTLITVLDDKTSLALLSNPEPSKKNFLQPSTYTNFVWEIKKHLASTQKKSLNWAVLPYQTEETALKQEALLHEIAKHYGFRISPRIAPRETFAELLNKGLTLFDLKTLGQMKTFEQLGAKRDCRKFAEFVLNLQKG